MLAQAEEYKKGLITDVIKAIRKRLGAKKAKQAETFARHLYANVPPDDLAGQSPENLAGAALSLLSHAERRKAGAAKIRIYDPDAKRHGWSSPHTIVEIINDDMPFLVDSVTAELNRQGISVRLVIHPIFTVERGQQGALTKIAPPADGDHRPRESVMQVQISEQPADRFKAIEAGLATVLEDVRYSVEDWHAMRHNCRDLILKLESNPPDLPRNEVQEGIDFLKWMDDDHFTYLGYREYDFQGSGARAVARINPKSGLGILRDPEVRVFEGLRNLGKLPADVRHFVREPELLRINKSNARATVHRPVHMDTIAVKIFDNKGNVKGERLFVGLFTSYAYSRSPRETPFLRQKVQRVMEKSGFSPGSHDGKALQHILETYPRDELFQMSVEDLETTAMGVLHLQERQRTALFVRHDPFERFVSCMVYVPRDRFDTRLRQRLQEILARAYNGNVISFATHLGEEALGRLHVLIKTTQGQVPKVDETALEHELSEASRSWVDFFEDALARKFGEQEGLRLLQRYEQAFPVAYQDDFDAATAVADVEMIERVVANRDLDMDLYVPSDEPDKDSRIHFKLIVGGRPLPLSDVLPMLENMGLKVIGEVPYEISPEREGTLWIHDFRMTVPGGKTSDIQAVRNDFHDVFARVWHGRMENDGFNRLVLLAGLTARQITVLRAYCKYLRQAAIPFSQEYMDRTLAANGHIARLLVDLFAARFDPAGPMSAKRKAGELVRQITEALEEVANLDEDRILRRYLNAVESTLRTNFYQAAEDGGEKTYCSFKLDSKALEELPLPKPFREIFVYSPRVEGVHLRFGKVARGGLRWSDRREDFRTEVLGLVKAQQVKNAVIVPVGSKGGFVVKNPPPPSEGREAALTEGIECYKTFIRGLLDLTDNRKGNDIIPPPQVVRHDDDDPYLVVAADKGTATFSDIANGVSQEYGFWLDDAFASGGSAGYDHKKMGITARGGWESVKRHFREIGKDIQNEDFTCLGVGDMSGDVFGNGMLLSRHIKLIAAFNHLHIFVDPEPDAAASWEERKRLFELPRSSWSDYDTKLISAGGGIFDRKAKSITVTPEMKAALRIDRDQVTPNELVTAILKAPAELMWFGGIGTYVKASDETHLEVGDRSNDSIRIDARQLGARVIGEGANLGVTQRGRIEFCQHGGACNTDFIDNSAGVDCSDHEVNIKILLGAVAETGKLSRQQRNKLLESMTNEVASQVLRDNYLQSQAISVTAQLGHHLLDRLARFMRALERSGHLNRSVEYLPDDEMVAERMKQQTGLTRPEIAVLLSYAKIVLYGEILESGLPDESFLVADLTRYFPTPLRKNYARRITEHRLRREIIATVITNDLVNHVGITFIHEVREKTGMTSEEIARAYIIAREILEVPRVWSEIEALDNKVPAGIQTTMLAECGRLVERLTVWFLREERHPLKIKDCIETYAKGVGTVVGTLPQRISEERKRLVRERVETFTSEGVPKDLAGKVASLSLLSPACDIVRIAGAVKLPVADVATVYVRVGERFGFEWLRRAAGHLPADTAWDKLAATAIIDDLFGHQGELTLRMLQGNGAAAKAPERLVETWAEKRRPQVARTEQLLNELQAAVTPDFAMLAVANRQMRSLVAG